MQGKFELDTEVLILRVRQFGGLNVYEVLRQHCCGFGDTLAYDGYCELALGKRLLLVSNYDSVGTDGDQQILRVRHVLGNLVAEMRILSADQGLGVLDIALNSR